MRAKQTLHNLRVYAVALSFAAVFAAGAAEPEIPRVTSKDIAGDFRPGRPVRFEGVVTGQFLDETNPDYHFATIKDDFGVVYLSVAVSNSPFAGTNDLTGCRVSVVGRVSSPLWKEKGMRQYLARELQMRNNDCFTILDAPREDPFAAPELSPALEVPPDRLADLGLRRLKGLVLAVRSRGEMLILTASNTVSHVTVRNESLPKAGDFIEAVGTAETDTYFLNLARATWRTTGPFAVEEPAAQELSARQILSQGEAQTTIRTDLHGKPVRIRAVVRSLPDAASDRPLVFAESDGVTFPIDVGSCPECVANLERGTTVDATGICWIDIDNWRPAAIFPQAKGFTLVLRTPEDIAVVSRPPWWTPSRLLAVIGAMSLMILAVLLWNRALRNAAMRQGRLLFREQVARMSAELRAKERSRLAVELHDSISQVLTGVALKIKAAQAMARTDLDRSLANLGIAESSLRSSREELRYCLWDLRNNIFDIPDFDEAVRQMLRPCIGDAEIAVRLQIQRRRISDSTAHEVLKIIRELAVNAVRHGSATKIRIAGSLDGDVLSFSVKDNGSGYDEASAPGPEQGHFGILGIRDRLTHFNGTLDMRGTRGAGTKATVSMHIDVEDAEEGP